MQYVWHPCNGIINVITIIITGIPIVHLIHYYKFNINFDIFIYSSYIIVIYL